MTAIEEMAASLLVTALDAAVPLWVERLRSRPWEDIRKRLPELSQVICERGDIILYQSKKRGETAKAFNALAEGIAALSFAPGGVRVFGRHWESKHPEVTYAEC